MFRALNDRWDPNNFFWDNTTYTQRQEHAFSVN
jgi:hypothetical protein